MGSQFRSKQQLSCSLRGRRFRRYDTSVLATTAYASFRLAGHVVCCQGGLGCWPLVLRPFHRLAFQQRMK